MQVIDIRDKKFDVASTVARELSNVSDVVTNVLNDIQENGDKAIVQYTKKFDGIDTGSIPRVMSRDELETYCRDIAVGNLTDNQKKAIETAVANVSWVASKSAPKSWREQAPDGQIVGETFTPYERIACYVPQGSFPLVSTAIHTAAIANTCGVKEIVMVTSPSNDELNPAVAYAAMLSGVTEIVFVGGAQGIAAVAFGTETIKRVDFICGPGNQYVAEAKRQLFGRVGIDMVAGPSEVFVVADKDADPYAVACDLVAQAEHGSGFEAAVLLTDSEKQMNAVAKELEGIKDRITDNPGFEQVWEKSLYLFCVGTIADAIAIVNQCAPEHVEVMTINASTDAHGVTNAGAVFVGGLSAEPLGDFVAGPSHVLPTNSSARFQSGLSAASFFRRVSLIEFDDASYKKLAPLAFEFASMEGLVGHGMSSIARLDEQERSDLNEVGPPVE
jgi:histidinol dehydrogenase